MATYAASCHTCRKRKVKCDRLYPCSNCERHNMTCYTSTKRPRPRGTQGGRRGREATELQARLARLESLVDTITAEAEIPHIQPSPSPRELKADLGHNPSPRDRLHRYVAGPVWSQLSAQIEGLREVLLPASDEEDVVAHDSELRSPPGRASQIDLLLCSNPNILVLSPEALEHPPRAMRQKLFSIYCSNLDPLCKIIHCPTVQSWIDSIDNKIDVSHEEAEIHATLFAIYAGAIITLPDNDFDRVVGGSKDEPLQRFRFATEYFLAKANYIESRTIGALQAFVIYLIVVRAQDAGQRHWALLGLAIQLARGLGLHSASSANNFRPLQREMRLRLWHILRMLDTRAALDRGMEPVMMHDSFDAPLPSNLNDQDLTEEMTIPPSPHEGLTDMSFVIVPLEGMTLTRKLYHLQIPGAELDPSVDIWQLRHQLVDEYENRMKSRFFQYCDDQVPIQWQLRYVTNTIVLFERLLVVRPMSRLTDQTMPQPPESSRKVLERALLSLQAESMFSRAQQSRGFKWYTWVQWYPLAVALVELCATPELVNDEAVWDTVQTSYERQSQSVADTAAGALWQPVKKLMKKVQSLRRTPPAASTADGMMAKTTARSQYLDHDPDFINSNSLAQADLITTDAVQNSCDFSYVNVGIPNLTDGDAYMLDSSNSFHYWDQFLGDITDFDPNCVWK